MLHYRQLYIDRPEPITFKPVTVDTSDRIYDDFLRLLFLETHREPSALANEILGNGILGELQTRRSSSGGTSNKKVQYHIRKAFKLDAAEK